ncbi:hypothetical protein MFU01_81780 [Myxococcus fulvus]|nr:hypothetical protein MFU01_81780 [Myxococcus fulvus]
MLATLVLLACAPAHADEQAAAPKDTKTQSSPKKDGAKQETPAKEDPEQSPEDAAPSKGGGQCTGKATFCGVYSSVFCNSQPGCSYSYSTNRCMGLAMECTKATSAAFCEKIKGCSWK